MKSENLAQLAASVRAGKPEAVPELWEAVHRFVEMEARRYASAFIGQTTAEDLTQSGYFAMMDAAELYEPARGASFFKVLRYCLHKRFAEETGVRTSRRDAMQYADSTDLPALRDDPEGPTVEDMIADDAALAAFAGVEYEDFVAYARRLIFSALELLPDNQRTLLSVYYFGGRNLEEAAQLAGYSCKQAAFDALRRALRFLQRCSKARELRFCLDAFEDYDAIFYAAGSVGGGRFDHSGMSSTEAAGLAGL